MLSTGATEVQPLVEAALPSSETRPKEHGSQVATLRVESTDMSEFSRQLVDVEGAQLEVYQGGAGQVVVCGS